MQMSSDGHRRARGPGPPADSTADGDPAWIRERIADIRVPLTIDGVATARDAARLRHEFTAWLALDVPREPLDDVVLAVYEAIANATEHAYAGHPDGRGPVRLTARRSSDIIAVTISDEGSWRPNTGDSSRGRGLPVIWALIEDVHLDRGQDGTVVHLRARVPVPGVPR